MTTDLLHLVSAASANDYRRWRIGILFTTRLCGGVPRSDELVGAWVRARTGYDDAQTKEQVDETLEALGEAVIEGEKSVWTTFLRDGDGLYLPERAVKAMLKENAKVLGIVKAKPGLGQVLQHSCHVHPERIHLGRMEPDGYEDKPVHVMTAQGPRTALKRYDFLEPGVQLSWTVAVAKGGKGPLVTSEVLGKILANAENGGLGANRSQGFGRFTVTLFEEVAPDEG